MVAAQWTRSQEVISVDEHDLYDEADSIGRELVRQFVRKQRHCVVVRMPKPGDSSYFIELLLEKIQIHVNNSLRLQSLRVEYVIAGLETPYFRLT